MATEAEYGEKTFTELDLGLLEFGEPRDHFLTFPLRSWNVRGFRIACDQQVPEQPADVGGGELLSLSMVPHRQLETSQVVRAD